MCKVVLTISKLDFNSITNIECEEVYNPDDAEEYGIYYATTK